MKKNKGFKVQSAADGPLVVRKNHSTAKLGNAHKQTSLCSPNAGDLKQWFTQNLIGHHLLSIMLFQAQKSSRKGIKAPLKWSMRRKRHKLFYSITIVKRKYKY